MSKVKYIIEADKEVIDIFLTKMHERYIINQYDGEVSICGRVLLSAFKTATPITESEDAVSRQVVKEQMLKYGFHAPDMTVTEFVEDLPPITPKREENTVSKEERTMDIFNNKERKVKCVRKYDTSPYGCDYEDLEIDKEYTVTNVDMHDWYTMITLSEFPNKRFNSVLFDEVKQ